jgi:hypothetical protein
MSLCVDSFVDIKVNSTSESEDIAQTNLNRPLFIEDIYVLIPQNTISINHPDTATQWDIETYFSYIFINIAVYVLQLTKTVV